MPQQSVPANRHIVAAREGHNGIHRVEMVGVDSGMDRPELQVVFGLDLTVLAGKRGRVCRLAEMSRVNRGADADAALIGGLPQTLSGRSLRGEQQHASAIERDDADQTTSY